MVMESHRIEIREFGGYADRVNVGEQAPRAKREFRGHGARERGCHFLVTGECDGAEFLQVGQHQIDRKSVGLGTSVSVRVDLGGRRTFKKKKQEKRATPA